MSENIVFGPVFSRRFGVSLGVDLSPGIKQCNFDCLYCELEKKRPIQKMHRIIQPQKILESIKRYSLKDVEVITITANGEPTLYPYLLEVITGIKQEFQQKTLILSNGSKFGDPKVQEALLKFDIVKFSLDAGLLKNFLRVDRPHRSLDLNSIKEGILDFSKIYRGQLVAEVLLVSDINDKSENIQSLCEFFAKIQNLSHIDLSTIDRPSAYDKKPVSGELLEDFANFMQKQLKIPINVPKRKIHPIELKDKNEEEIIQLIKHRPIEIIEMQKMLTHNSLNLLNELLIKKKIEIKETNGKRFYLSTRY